MPSSKRSSTFDSKIMPPSKRIKGENCDTSSLENSPLEVRYFTGILNYFKTDESNEKSSFENLPPEVLEKILGNLPTADLCNVVLSSRHLRDVGNSASLWSKMKVNRHKLITHGLKDLLNIERFKKLQRLDLSDIVLDSSKWQNMLRDICHSQIKEVDLSRVDLTTIGSSLNTFVPRLKKLNISETCINTHQIESFLKRLISSNNFEDLNMEYVDLSEVKPDLLAETVSVLKRVNLKDTYLPVDSCIEMLEKGLKSSRLRHVNFEGVDLSGVPCDLISQFVSQLQSVNLQNTNLTPEQRSELMKVVKSSKSLQGVEDIMMTLLGLPVSFTGTNTTYRTFGWFVQEESECDYDCECC